MNRLKWVVAAKKADFNSIASKYNIDPVLARIIRNRDVISDEDINSFLNGDISSLHDPYLFKDMKLAIKLIKGKVAEGKKIRIIGDYDVDGICATYILLKGLKTIGAQVDTVIPHRIIDGYGLNDQLIEQAREDGIDTIITCDNGIAAAKQIDLAKEYNMTVIVTDHHEVPYIEESGEKKYILPKADALVDPKQDDCPYPFKGVCGAMIAYKLVSVLLENNHKNVLEELIPFAAMATVCDVMELLDENRIIVKEGLKLMKNPVNTGLRALMIVTGLSEKKVSAYHFGFVLGPTINATGRLDTAQRALELFDTDDFNKACMIATQLKELNDSRKKLTEDGTDKAINIIETNGYDKDNVLVVYLKDTHESIAGIIAGRIKEKYYKPTIVLTEAEDGVKGSGRSIEGYNMYEELTKVNDLFTKYGGHKMAAGVSLANEECIEELRKRLNANQCLTKEDLCRKLKIDVPMPLSYITKKLIQSFELLEPCGTANPKPLFADKDISLLSYEKRGRSKVIGKFKVCDQTGNKFDMVYFDDLSEFDSFIIENFGQGKYDLLTRGRCDRGDILIKIAYNPDINVYNNIESIQLVMKYYDI